TIVPASTLETVTAVLVAGEATVCAYKIAGLAPSVIVPLLLMVLPPPLATTRPDEIVSAVDPVTATFVPLMSSALMLVTPLVGIAVLAVSLTLLPFDEPNELTCSVAFAMPNT